MHSLHHRLSVIIDLNFRNSRHELEERHVPNCRDLPTAVKSGGGVPSLSQDTLQWSVKGTQLTSNTTPSKVRVSTVHSAEMYLSPGLCARRKLSHRDS